MKNKGVVKWFNKEKGLDSLQKKTEKIFLFTIKI